MVSSGPQESFLETPTTVLALVFLGFQVSCIVFQFIVNSVKRYLRRHNRLGMLTAVEHSVWELTLVGFISLCLIALQNELTHICVDASANRSNWSILHHMYAPNKCDCCLSTTAYVQDCIVEYASCGNPTDKYCNCDQKNASCVAPLYDTMSGYGYYASPPYEATADDAETHSRRLLAGSSAPANAEACLNSVTVPNECPSGQMPAVSFLALEQVHLLIFTIAVVHVLCGFLLYMASSARLFFQWRRWSDIDDDEHTLAVQAKLEEYYATLDSSSAVTGRTLKVPTPAVPAVVTDGGEEKLKTSSPGESASDEVVVDLESQKESDGALMQSPFASEANASQPVKKTVSIKRVLNRSKSGNQKNVESSLLSGRTVSKPLPELLRQLSGHSAQKSNPSRLAAVIEYFKCLVLGLSPTGVVSRDRYCIMRASYVYTHKLSTHFAFLDHVQRNLEDDLSHIVGLSVEFWSVIILFILVSGPYGYAVMPFLVLIAAVLIITNGKLVEITRAVTSRGGVGRLTSKVFWFNRPQLLLIPIKLALFLCSFIYASFLFFAWQFGAHSCPFNDGFYPGWVLPWWTILLFNTVIFIHMGIVTLPTYSLAVLMGSDIKAHMLPKKFTKKLLAVAAAAKEKVKAEKAAAAAAGSVAGGSSHGAGLWKLGLGSGASDVVAPSASDNDAAALQLAERDSGNGAATADSQQQQQSHQNVQGEDLGTASQASGSAAGAMDPAATASTALQYTNTKRNKLQRVFSKVAHHLIAGGHHEHD